jgi:hypothetical protein
VDAVVTRTDQAARTATDPVTGALRDFDPVRSRQLRRALQFFWIFQGLLLVADVLLFRAAGTTSTIRLLLVLSPHLFAAWAALLAYRCLDRVRDALRRLWDRNAFTVSAEDANAARPAGSPSVVADRYADFVRRLDEQLDGRDRRGSGWQRRLRLAAPWGFAVTFAWLLYWFYPVAGYDWGFPVRIPGAAWWIRALFTLDIGLQVVLAMVLGLVAWRLVVVAAAVSSLATRFEFKLHVQDPDKSAGLKPAGDLCFSIAAIWAVVAIYPTAWLSWMLVQLNVRHPGTTQETFTSSLCPPQVAGHCLPFLGHFTLYFGLLLLLTFALAAGTFFLPLYAVHRGMERARPDANARLDALARHIDQIASEASKEPESQSADDLTAKIAKLTSVRQVYDANASVPTWPFDVKILGKFVGATIVPLTGVTVWLPALVGKLVGA